MKNIKMRIVAITAVMFVALTIFASASVFAAENGATDAAKVTVITASTVANANGQGVNSITSQYDGGWGQSWVERTLYDDGNLNDMIVGATLPAGVGFTIMAETANAYLIDTFEEQYVHLAGVWISKTGSLTINNTAIAGVVTASTTAYGGTSSTNYEAVGSISSGDTVTVLAKSGNWYFIEFNDVYYLRKRGWVPSSYINTYYGSTPDDYSQLIGQTSYLSNNNKLVYYAPGLGYSAFDTFAVGQTYTLVDFMYINGVEFAAVDYIPSGNTKVRTGYIIW